MNTFEVRKEIKKDLRKVLILCKIPYKFQENILESPITQEMFEDYVSRAECEKKSRETGMTYVSQKEAENDAYMAVFLHTRKEKSYCIM